MDEEWRGNATSNPSTSPAYTTLSRGAKGTQELRTSFGHPYQLLGKNDGGDIGGPFSVVRREYKESIPYMHNRTVTDDTNVNAYNYKGSYFANDAYITDASFSPVVHPSNTELDAMGTTAIARSIPTNPIGGALVFLGELRSEGLPLLVGAQTWRERALRARNAGGEYLNVEFGWKPLISEIQTFADVVRNADTYIARFVRESGKLLHRRYTFPPTNSTSTTVQTGVYPNPSLKVGYWNASGTRTTVVRTNEQNWFSGAFTYYVPPLDPGGTNFRRNEQIANKLYGTRVTPEVVWNLTPWSWAVDWFTNLGDVIHNISAFQNDGLVMPYGYMMRKRTVVVDVSLTGARAKRDNREIKAYQQFTTTVKTRRKATPYGFGLNTALLSGRQWAILAALGLTKGGGPGMKYD